MQPWVGPMAPVSEPARDKRLPYRAGSETGVRARQIAAPGSRSGTSPALIPEADAQGASRLDDVAVWRHGAEAANRFGNLHRDGVGRA